MKEVFIVIEHRHMFNTPSQVFGVFETEELAKEYMDRRIGRGFRFSVEKTILYKEKNVK